MTDIYKEGAALASGASTAIADLISDCAGDRFKKAFHETLVSYVVTADGATRELLVEVIKAVSRASEAGRSPEETRELVQDRLP